MRRLQSLIMRMADQVRVPAGAALAVDRDRFSEAVTAAVAGHPLIRIERGEVTHLPASDEMSPLIVATGPLTSAGLSADIAAFVGAQHLAFFDAISPIVLAETIDHSRVFRASRWNRSLGRDGAAAGAGSDGEGDYLNCPFTKDEYLQFHQAIFTAEKAAVHDFDSTKFFEGCLPIEVMAHRGPDTLRFGPMKPAGLTDPRTGRWPYAVVQLRQDNLAADHFSLVGFQTQLKWGEQARVLRMIPGLEQAEFVRFGMIHRNTYINAPRVLTETWQTRTRPDLLFAGQVSGVEGYVESAASGLIAGRNAARLALGLPTVAPPRTTAIGALGYYVSHALAAHYEPSNITFGIIPPLAEPPRGRQERQLATSERALADLERWAAEAAGDFTPAPAGSAVV
jgi:methylenetetrahydrofolate--tRNA-(uracil-5-)-methyltransferase